MQLTEEINKLKGKIAEAQELSAHHKREMNKNPDNFLFQLRYDRFKDFIDQLEEDLGQCEKLLQKQLGNNEVLQPLICKSGEITRHLSNTMKQIQMILTITMGHSIFDQYALIISMQKKLDQDKDSKIPTLVLTELNLLNVISRADLGDFNKIANSLSLVWI